MTLPLFKYHALGNDYIVMDPAKITSPCNLTQKNIELICHRNFGFGSDGILYGPFQKNGQLELRLQIFNPDGSEAEKSGNGIRIFSRYLLDAGYVTADKPFTLKTLGGDVRVEFMKDGLIKVDMGKAIFESSKIPVGGTSREVVKEKLNVNGKDYFITCVSVGNPHCVIHLDSISEKLAREIGPSIENNPLFPNRINMQLVKILDRKNIQIEIWERGAGYTLASGSSSCAASLASYKLGLVDSDLTVHMPGGKISISITSDGHVHMTGPVTKVADGVLDSQFLSV